MPTTIARLHASPYLKFISRHTADMRFAYRLHPSAWLNYLLGDATEGVEARRLNSMRATHEAASVQMVVHE